MYSKPLIVLLLGLLTGGIAGDQGVDLLRFEQVDGYAWQACEAGLTYNGKSCRGQVRLLNWQEALNYCAKLEHVGRWRLPSREELLNYYVVKGRSALHFVNVYWTSSTDIENPELAWYLVPTINLMYTNYKELVGLTLCVAEL